jgi:hypothetical protein
MRDQSNPDQPPLDAMVSDLKEVVEDMVTTLRSIIGHDVAMEVLKTVLVDHNEGISLADLVQTSLLGVADFQTTYN